MSIRQDAFKLFILFSLYHVYVLNSYVQVLKPYNSSLSRARMQKVEQKLQKVSLGQGNNAKTKTIRIYLVTWNVGGTGPCKDLTELLDLQAKTLPDIYGIGFQEMDPSESDDKTNQWTSRLTDTLGERDYVRLKVIRMQAISLQVYVKRSLLLNITSVESEFSKAGMGGWWGNKGGVSIRFDIGGVNLIIVNTHLAAHLEQMAERIEDFNTVLQTQKFRDPDVENILDHDYVFWMGDLNCRIEGLSKNEVLKLIEENNIEKLLKHDQLKQAQQEGLMFVDFNEGPITFKPTYKFDKDTDVYDTSTKERVPSWCDRILWKAHADIDGLQVQKRKYYSPAYSYGDHKPVAAKFDVNIFTEQPYPFVNFDPISKWQYGKDGTFHYTVRKGIQPDTSSWDWIGLYPANFKTFDDQKTFVYARNNAEDYKEGAALAFAGKDLKVPPGKYVLCYISKYKTWLRGMSNVFEIVP
ncbi:phosphatidylinositol 4,5-bisphosphate 5-phosphatase A-like isoform X2 [Dreissena polymorpha]|uniref:phosphatidylinositol 4,5-bisphosphate 5-phosphatase A-like isoform X2 n=1 Tax=Dreissena polymorpha TaxID=45954 RepID=UPI0022647651|nr:phosphatidylinositol 4,5-bisphosphate 5-phosphatase A-like isoform X2 [Dreissena polymorpha]